MVIVLYVYLMSYMHHIYILKMANFCVILILTFLQCAVIGGEELFIFEKDWYLKSAAPILDSYNDIKFHC